MHQWTKEALLEKWIATCRLGGYEPSERARSIYEWVGELAEAAYNDGFKDGKEAARADNLLKSVWFVSLTQAKKPNRLRCPVSGF